MAQTLASSSSPLVLITFLLFSIANPRAHAVYISPGSSSGAPYIILATQFVMVTGKVCCTTNGNCPGNPVVGVTVNLNCFTDSLNFTVVATNTTQADGTFSITAPTSQSLLGQPTYDVTLTLPLPAAVCPALFDTSGSLIGFLKYPGTVTNDSAMGTVLNLQLLTFIASPI